MCEWRYAKMTTVFSKSIHHCWIGRIQLVCQTRHILSGNHLAMSRQFGFLKGLTHPCEYLATSNEKSH